LVHSQGSTDGCKRGERFLEDVRLPLGNNASERALRRVGRKNYLFIDDVQLGRDIAGLYVAAQTIGMGPALPTRQTAALACRPSAW
jgi:hypothetical protein